MRLSRGGRRARRRLLCFSCLWSGSFGFWFGLCFSCWGGGHDHRLRGCLLSRRRCLTCCLGSRRCCRHRAWWNEWRLREWSHWGPCGGGRWICSRSSRSCASGSRRFWPRRRTRLMLTQRRHRGLRRVPSYRYC